jgi:hypothetical protein
MSLHIEWEQHETHGVARLAGSPSLGQFLSFVELLAVESIGWPHGRLLADLRGVSTLQSFTEQFTIGEEAARKLRHLRRIASVVPAERITRNSERPARQKGLDLKVFDDESAALDWLLADEPGPG